MRLPLSIALLAAVAMGTGGCGGAPAAPHRSAVRVSVRGPLVTTWGNDGRILLPNEQILALARDRKGRLLGFGSKSPTLRSRPLVVRFNPTGALDRGFGSRGVVDAPEGIGAGWTVGTVRADGAIVAAGTTGFGIAYPGSRLVVATFDASGRLDLRFGRGGYVVFPARTCARGPTGIAAAGTRVVLGVLCWCTFNSPKSVTVISVGRNGVDRSFGKHGTSRVGEIMAIADWHTPLLVLHDGRILVASAGRRPGTIQVIRFLPDGRRDPSFGVGGTAVARVAASSDYLGVDAVFRAKLGLITVTGCTADGAFIARFNRDGSAYRFWNIVTPGRGGNVETFGGAFGSACPTFAQLSTHEIVAAGTGLLHVYPSGVLDPHHQLATLPPDLLTQPHVLLAAPDGSVFVTSQLRRSKTLPRTAALISRYR